MAEIKPFHLDGGPKGHRFIIDVGNAEFKPSTEPTQSQPDAELKAKQDAELKAKQDAELKARQERELELARRERELEQRERELKEKQEAELKAKQEAELQAKREAELKAQQERERELERRERELEKRERELKEKQERELKRKQEREQKAKLEKEIKEQREREKALKEKEKKERREKKDKDKNKKDEPEVEQPFTELEDELETITALKGKKIVIDPGHGGNDAGAIGPTGVMEKNVTLKVSLELKRLLEKEGAEVILTREDDRTVSPKGAAASDIEELGARCDVANRNGADIFISIHADAFTRPEARGTTAYYYSKSTTGRGQKLADCIRRNLVEQLGTPSRGTQPCNFYVVKHTDMPATLVELGFISNKDEEKLLDSKEGVQKAAQGILDGIEDYFG